MLAATFANSPFDSEGHATGFRSTRLAVWDAIDRGRTSPAYTPGLDARSAWTRYALDATTMMIRVDDTRSAALREPMPFGRWIAEGHELGWPTLDDFEYGVRRFIQTSSSEVYGSARYTDRRGASPQAQSL
jgi:glutamate--cysteine ligase